jgi:hypothetical protein
VSITEDLDRELIVERAEAVRFWLLGLGLSSRATSAIQQELGGIIDNDPGGYINGARPLAGLTVDDFIAELHKPNAGLVSKVRGVGTGILADLRAKVPPTANGHPDLSALAEYDPDEGLGELVSLPSSVEEVPVVEAVSEVELPFEMIPPKRRGRPKRTDAPLNEHPRLKQKDLKEAVAPAKFEPAPELVATPVAPSTGTERYEPDFEHFLKLWASLHPQGRRAVVGYMSELIIEV